MKLLRNQFDRAEHLFMKGGRLEKLYPLYEMFDTMAFTPGHVTRSGSHVRDGLDLKRMMFTVVVALQPVVIWAMYNAGYQAASAISQGATPLDRWQTWVYTDLLGLAFDPSNVLTCFIYGALFFVPIVAVVNASGGLMEVLFAVSRKHEVNEGFLVTGALIPLIIPPAIPLWMVALGTMFGVVFAKEVFGGTGMNFLNPALTARAFLFFAYPAAMSGDAPWIAADFQGVDSFSGATILAQAAAGPVDYGNMDAWWASFIGLEPGSLGETSALLCLVGAAVLLYTRIGSWRTMAGVTIGTAAIVFLFNAIGSDTNPMFAMPFHWHIVAGGWMFGMVFMATDPVSSAYTNTGRWWYGIGIGVMVALVRVVNPAYPEGMMLAILFMNMFAPLIDHFVIRQNVKRRKVRYAD
ncbi:NADH:ubiquinone reductase (Na(+)-transporting) subunit B [Gaopeijia maritima]|uniref:NADH:ubiquinone reductase (Na(+)-transporting) subunit B n=1 Tax=Gaopeijia maritima TaxID=3119007 RepID=UPI003254D565